MAVVQETCPICLGGVDRVFFWHDERKAIPHFLHPFCLAKWLRGCQETSRSTRCPRCFTQIQIIYTGSDDAPIAQRVDQFVRSQFDREAPVPSGLRYWWQEFSTATRDGDRTALRDLLSEPQFTQLRQLRPMWINRCLIRAFQEAIACNQLDSLEVLLERTELPESVQRQGCLEAYRRSFLTLAVRILERSLSGPQQDRMLILALLRDLTDFAIFLLRQGSISRRGFNDAFVVGARRGNRAFLEYALVENKHLEAGPIQNAIHAAQSGGHATLAAMIREKTS
jgi:hypothetical protein